MKKSTDKIESTKFISSTLPQKLRPKNREEEKDDEEEISKIKGTIIPNDDLNEREKIFLVEGKSILGRRCGKIPIIQIEEFNENIAGFWNINMIIINRKIFEDIITFSKLLDRYIISINTGEIFEKTFISSNLDVSFNTKDTDNLIIDDKLSTFPYEKLLKYSTINGKNLMKINKTFS